MIGVAICVGCVVLLAVVVTFVGVVNDRHRVDAGVLEHEIRNGLPTGSSLSTVEELLEKRGFKFSFEARSKTIYAAAHKLKGSNFVTVKDLMLKFHFDDSLKLTSIDSQVLYTGP
jgi:hypothetical protein